MRYAVININDDYKGELKEAGKAFTDAIKTGEYQGEHFTFETPATLFSAITPKRWELITKLQAINPVSMRELAKRLKRDVKNVHSDVHALLDIGLIEKNKQGKLYSPFDEIRTNFTLKKAA